MGHIINILLILLLLLQTLGLGQTPFPAETFVPEEPEETAAAEPAEAAAEPLRGAESLEELLELLAAKPLFSPEQVNCMGYEMLLASVTACDPENGLALMGDCDPEEIAALLYERFFPAVGLNPLRYEILRQYPFQISDDIIQGTLNWFKSQKSSVIAQYGETNYERIRREVEGYEFFYVLDYTVTDSEGASREDRESQGNSNGLLIIQSNGRFFWTAFDLFSGIAG